MFLGWVHIFFYDFRVVHFITLCLLPQKQKSTMKKKTKFLTKCSIVILDTFSLSTTYMQKQTNEIPQFSQQGKNNIQDRDTF